MINVIALDPGLTTGVFHWTEDRWWAHEYSFDDTSRMLELICQSDIPTADIWIVAERFIIGPQTVKNTQAPWSLEMIGVARHFSRRYCGRELTLQSPAEAKRFASDIRLKHLGWHTPGKGHANDAARHALTFIANRGLMSQAALTELVELY